MHVVYGVVAGAVGGFVIGVVFYADEIAAGRVVIAAGQHAKQVAIQKAHDVIAAVRHKAVDTISKI